MLRADIFLAAAARPGADEPWSGWSVSAGGNRVARSDAAAATNGRIFDWLVANFEISWRPLADQNMSLVHPWIVAVS
jgi:hypothetical protein